jgi:two-component sensor histidine kinase
MASEMQLSRSVRAAADARSFTRSWLGRRLADGDADDLQIVVSELVANAVVHGREPITLRLDRADHIVTVGVADGSRILPHTIISGSRHFGLRIVDALSERWGTEPGDVGKTTWAEVRLR